MRRFTLPVVLATFAIASCSDGPTIPASATDELSIQSARGGSSRTKSVTVTPSSATIQQGQTLQLTATTKPPGGTVTWSSSNTAAATVDQSGLVTGVAPGSATITASSGGKSAVSSITVISPPTGGVTFVGAGDIASCSSSGDEATANLLDGIAGTVFTLGDNVYDNGTLTEFNNCYDPTWGRHKSRTFPSAGNHEYNTPGATGYYAYFGAPAGDPAKGYYSYDLGDWHIIVLNSNIARDAGSAQITWLNSDLAANAGKACTLAYWHHPRFSSGSGHGNNTSVQEFWNSLYAANADIILGGHDHTYERFAPQNPSGVADPARGIREFVVGTGGRSHYALGTLKANSEVFNSGTFGVLKLTLSAGGYSWQFVPVAGGTFTDSGSGSCH